MTNDNANFTEAENTSPELKKMLEENAEIIADFDRENAMFSSIIAGGAAGIEGKTGEERETGISTMTEMFESVRVQQNMSPKLFRVYIETCLEKRKFLMPVLAFAYFQHSRAGMEKLEQDKELTDDLAKWIIRKTVPGADLLMDENKQESAVISEEETDKPTGDVKADVVNSENTTAPFDELAKKANETQAMEDLNALFGAAFALPEWLFIARGELPNVNPYIAANPQSAGGQQMVRAFTDSVRLQRFARENNLTDAGGNTQILTIPIKGVVEYLEQFIEYGVHGVWFNSDMESDGFFIPLKQLRPIKEHLAKLDQPPNDATKTALLLVQDGLGFPSGFVSEAGYRLNIFCRVPESWTDGERLKPESQEKIFEFLYGANWRMGNDDGSRYIVIDSFSKVFDEETVKNTRWEGTENTDKDHYRFYLVGDDGAVRSVKSEEFQAAIDAERQQQTVDDARQNQDNAANFGVPEAADGGFDQNLRINTYGNIKFETSIRPFYHAIVPLLADFEGTGDFVTLMRYEPEGISELVEGIEKNAHGNYLQVRRFYYLNPKNNARLGVNNIHSRILRHTKTNTSLTVSFELVKLLDEPHAAVFYHCFEGPREVVLKLQEAIRPVLESQNYVGA